MIKLNTPVELDIRSFFKWWISELSDLVPVWLRKLVIEKEEYVLIASSGEHFCVSLVSDEPGKNFGEVLLNEEGQEMWDNRISGNPEIQKIPIVLRLQPGQALVKTASLPLAAESNLYQVVGFEMERLTPFKLDQVYYDVRLIEKLVDLNQIKIELALIPKKSLDALLTKLAGLALHPGRVDVLSSDEDARNTQKLHYNLLPRKLHDKPNNRKRVIQGSLLATFGLLLVSIGALPIWMKHKYMLELEAEVERQTKAANQVQNLKQKADTLLRESDFLLRKKTAQPVLVEILNELTTRLPDDTWLEYFTYNAPKLQIHGQSPSASALIEILEGSTIFKDTSFISQVSQDRISGLERFQITTLVVSGAGIEQPSK
ncbi:MAG: PilN domain-containing protein [Methylococcales bacterium]